MGEAAKQRAPEPPVFTHLSLARASMKIWCIFKSDTAIKWRELLVVEEPSPLACVSHNIFGITPVLTTAFLTLHPIPKHTSPAHHLSSM